MHTAGNYVLSPLLQYMPKLTPIILGFSFQAMQEQYGKLQKCEVVRAPWAIHFRDGIGLMPCYDMEFAFPINLQTPTKAVEAINWVVWVTIWYALSGKTECQIKEGWSEEEGGGGGGGGTFYNKAGWDKPIDALYFILSLNRVIFL